MVAEKSKNRKIILTKTLRFTLWSVLIAFMIIALLIIGANMYLKSNETKILKNISFINQGTISFNEAHISIFKDFPNASIVLKNAQLVDSLYQNHGNAILEAEELSASLSLKEWKNKSFEIKKIELFNGSFHMIKDTLGYSNLLSIIPNKNKNQEISNENNDSKIQVNTEQISLELENFEINIQDYKSSLHIHAMAKHLTTDITIDSTSVKGKVDFDLLMKELTLNIDDGSYLQNARLNSNIDFTHHHNIITCQPFTLHLNEEIFEAEAVISLDNKATSIIKLKNDQSILKNILPILTDKLAKTIEPYDVKGSFKSNTEIKLKPGDPAKITIDFELPNNAVSIGGVVLKNTKATGRFINRKYDDGLTDTESNGHIRLDLSEIYTRQGNFSFTAPNALITSDPINNTRIKSQVTVSGDASEISKWYESEKFFFADGTFVLTGDAHGPLNDINQLILESSADLTLKDLSVWYKPADASVPIDLLELAKRPGEAQFNIISTTFLESNDYQIDGALQNLTALLINFAEESASSQVNLNATKLSWSDFIGMFSLGATTSDSTPKTERESKKSMKETLRGIYQKFEPTIDISIDTFEYFDIVDLYQLQTGAKFLNENILVLEDSKFIMDQGEVSLNAKLDINHPNQTKFNFELDTDHINLRKLLPKFDYFNINLLAKQDSLPVDFDLTINMSGVIDDVAGLLPNTAQGEITFSSKHHDDFSGSIVFIPDENTNSINSNLQLEGNPFLFNDFFQNDKFIFQDTGRFEVNFDYDGEITSFDQLMEEAIIDLKITNGAVYYTDVDVIFPLNNLQLSLQRDQADYSIFMYSDLLDRELNINGHIQNLSELLFGNTGKELKTQVDAYSPLINLVHAFEIFGNETNEVTKPSEEQIDTKMKRLVGSLLNRFNPSLHVQLDSFVIDSSFILTNFSSGARLQDSTKLILEQTDFKFYDALIGLNAIADISYADETPFTGKLFTKNLDLQKMLASFNYFGSESLSAAEKLNGLITLELDIKGKMKKLGLEESYTKATLDFHINDLELKGIDFIDKIAAKLLARRYMNDLKFAPLHNRITVTGSRIDIPQMEIMSNGIDLFVEGHVDNKNKTNLWLSVPLDNLKRLPESSVVPPKRGYAASKRKVYLEISTDDDGKTKSKLRFKKKRFYDQRDILDQYNLDKEKNKKEYLRLKKQREQN